MTAHFPAIALTALVVAAGFGATETLAQDAAKIVNPATEVNINENTPDWPAGLQDWDNPPRDPEGNPNEAEERGLLSPEVQENDAEGPTEQGTRTTETLDEEEDPGLYQLLAIVRASPPGIDGELISRPNPLASEPVKEMNPMQPEDVYLFPDGYVE